MRLAAWRREIRLWLPAALLLLANLGALGVYRAFFGDDVEVRVGEVNRLRADYESLTSRRQRAQRLATRAQQNNRRLERLYRNRFKTQEQRITAVISEVKGLALKAGLDPPTIRYPDAPVEAFGLVKRSIVFNVNGTYQSLRKFINFLELTDSFVILEEIRPGDNAGQGRRLSIALRISTFFLDDDIDPAALALSPQTVESRR